MVENGDTSSTTVADLEHVETVVRRSGSSFYWAMRLLPEAKRGAMFAIYAFCREIDDIADEPGKPADKLARLGEWRGEIDRLYGGRPGIEVTRALAGPIERFGLCKDDFHALIDGMEMDAVESLRIADMEELNLYCERVACAVGRLCNRVFGVEPEKGDRIALALGQALQLTNVLRDLGEDTELDRVYLPADLLRAHGIDGTDANEVLSHPDLPLACAPLGDIAKRRFKEAKALLDTCDRRQVRSAVVMMEAYRRILKRLERLEWRYTGKPAGLSTAEKLWVLLRHGIL